MTTPRQVVSAFRYLQPDAIPRRPLKFKRAFADILLSECGKYEVERSYIGHDDFVFYARYIGGSEVTELGMEASAADAKRECEIHAGRLQ